MTTAADPRGSDRAFRDLDKELPMAAMQAYLVTIYQAELRRQAEQDRLAADHTLSGEVRFGHQLPAGAPRPDPRRSLARLAATVSRAAAGTARWLDPTIEVRANRGRASGAAGR
jgi:hypothetical protein